MRKLLFVLLGLSLLMLAGCSDGPPGQSRQALTTPKVSPAVLAALPPDPGKAGKKTLAGIDRDHNGLRDDVQRWIATHYPDSEKTRAALRQKAVALQTYIEDTDASPDKARRDAVAIDKASECLEAIRGDFYTINRDFDAVVLNTYPRLHTYLTIDKKYGDTSGSRDPSSEWKKNCDFDPDKMKN